ncbi:MAG: hypothetical protein HQL37_01150 [Alphaproteobacteria bacterium]|nr:hypothetical protein [Alphaproteobacteria bacterium]
MKMTFLRIEKGFDGPWYSAVFDCEDIIGTESRVWQIKYTREQVVKMLVHPDLGTEMRKALEAFPES